MLIAASCGYLLSISYLSGHGLLCGDTACSCATIANVAINVGPPQPPRSKSCLGGLQHRAGSRRFEQIIVAASDPAALNLGDTVLAAELVDPPARIKSFLLAGIERMTCRAHFDEEVLAKRGTGCKFVAAATGDLDIVVGGMNLGFHCNRPEVLRCEKGA